MTPGRTGSVALLALVATVMLGGCGDGGMVDPAATRSCIEQAERERLAAGKLELDDDGTSIHMTSIHEDFWVVEFHEDHGAAEDYADEQNEADSSPHEVVGNATIRHNGLTEDQTLERVLGCARGSR